MTTPDDPSRRTVAAAIKGTGKTPMVLASGYGEVAQQILALAFEQGIKVREDADLAEILAAVEIGEAIPLEALQTVTEILARVYVANGQTAPDNGPDSLKEDPS